MCLTVLCVFCSLYLEHIRYVDDGVERLVATIEDHYDHDQKTAYVFTSDHGMTDWGKTLLKRSNFFYCLKLN
ncbi:hypothetical protein DPMN_018198 [Dreissena polymorpha]|uniref:GPI ethanolamine phosphate transferase 1 n=1 Tax=Dreissena polymorpha TaxID=45954 RepID=A0A9D4NGT5_DREPO|nr:hypothetical protein DPMN_018198 [Dreissena polymorpha]